MERKDALTKRPLDFDREEEARKFETTKWLENHFGSDSQSSRGSTDGDLDRHNFEQEPTKKSYFNVTIKSGPNNPTPPPVKAPAPHKLPHNGYNGYAQNKAPQKLTSPAKVQIPERGEPTRAKVPPPPPMKYFQGVSNWAERKDTARVFSNKAFHDELKGTVERKKLNKAGTNYVMPRDEEIPSDDSLKHYPTRESDLGYNSGSRNDLRPHARKIPYQEEEFYNPPIARQYQAAVNRGSSYDVRKASREDLRFRSTSNLLNSRDEREDSAYISGSTHFTSPHSPKMGHAPQPMQMMSPSNGYRHQTPVDSAGRPVVPMRKRGMERKMKLTAAEIPRPDYSPRSRSPSPTSMKTASTTNLHHQRDISYQPAGYNTLQTPGSKKNRHSRMTRFSSEQPVPAPDYAAATTTERKKKLGSSIGQSLRKLVGKIRSASSDRKSKAKSSSPPVVVAAHSKQNGKSETSSSTTYQPYNNNIDNHINDNDNDDDDDDDDDEFHHDRQQQQQQLKQPPGVRHQSAPPPPTQPHKKLTSSMSADAGAGGGARPMKQTASSHHETIAANGRTGDPYGSSAYHSDNYDSSGGGGGGGNGMNGPKQRFYLGEDPYKGSIYGRENKYDINSIRMANQQRLGGGGGLRKINSPDDDIYNNR